MKIVLLSIFALLALANIFMFAMPQGQKASLIYSDIQHQGKSVAVALKDGNLIYFGANEHVYPLIDKETKIEKMNGFELEMSQDELMAPANFKLKSGEQVIHYENGQKKSS